jgi:tRNA threonylcarbamoyladenosine biosynthesis protein TsaE
MTTLLVHTRSADETTAFGERIGSLLVGGEVLLLSGDLGTGKTTFVKGLARGLGISELPFSPTFTIVHSYAGGRLPLVHVDLYRTDSSSEVAALGLEDLFEPPAVSAIEWGEKALPVVTDDYLELAFAWESNDDDRAIKVTPYGSWRAREAALLEIA